MGRAAGDGAEISQQAGKRLAEGKRTTIGSQSRRNATKCVETEAEGFIAIAQQAKATAKGTLEPLTKAVKVVYGRRQEPDERSRSKAKRVQSPAERESGTRIVC